MHAFVTRRPPSRSLASRSLQTRLGRHHPMTLSAVQGSDHPPLDSRTLYEYFKSTNTLRLERPALICPFELPRPHGGPLTSNMGVSTHLSWSYSELDHHIQALARGLVSLGVKRGDRIGVVMGNTRLVRA